MCFIGYIHCLLVWRFSSILVVDVVLPRRILECVKTGVDVRKVLRSGSVETDVSSVLSFLTTSYETVSHTNYYLFRSEISPSSGSSMGQDTLIEQIFAASENFGLRKPGTSVPGTPYSSWAKYVILPKTSSR